MSLDAECKIAIDRAKAATRDGEKLNCALLLAALYRSDSIKSLYPGIASLLPKLETVRDPASVKVPLDDEVKPILSQAINSDSKVTPEELWERLIATGSGARLVGSVASTERIEAAKPDDQFQSSWRSLPKRRQVVEALSSFGRFLTDIDLSQRQFAGKEREISALIRTLSKMKRRNALIVGHPGTGKSALVYELARRVRAGESSLPVHLRDNDIFEMSSSFLRSGASVVGQYEERVKALLEALKQHPKIILFIDEIHSFFQSGMHHRGPFTDANESFKAELGRGEICVIGCTTLAEYRNYIEPDGALTRRFTVIRVEPPDTKETLAILQRKKPALERYHNLTIEDNVLARSVELTNEHLAQRYQPDKSIQLLDAACAFASSDQPPSSKLSERYLIQALEEIAGRKITAAGDITEADVRSRLDGVLLGQHVVTEPLARAVVAGLGRFRKHRATRGVFLFAGPTGTGKTKAAKELAGILGENALLRVDCNMLGGTGYDAGPAISKLLGVNKGYLGYARGEGGLLSKVRDMPESVVLFDEIEKAPAGIFKILLQIIDEGKVEDSDGNPLDFRRSFIVFTTNAGSRCAESRDLGFKPENAAPALRIGATKETVFAALRTCGCGEEFLARLGQVFVFVALDQTVGRAIIERGVEDLRCLVKSHGFSLEASEGLVDHLLATWNPGFGARHALSILSNRIVEQLGVADAQGELVGVTVIKLSVWDESIADAPGGAVRRRDGILFEIAIV